MTGIGAADLSKRAASRFGVSGRMQSFISYGVAYLASKQMGLLGAIAVDILDTGQIPFLGGGNGNGSGEAL